MFTLSSSSLITDQVLIQPISQFFLSVLVLRIVLNYRVEVYRNDAQKILSCLMETHAVRVIGIYTYIIMVVTGV